MYPTAQPQNKMDSVTPKELERLYPRLERLGATDRGTILNWLRKDQNENIVRRDTSGLRAFSDYLAEPFEARDKIKEARDFETLSNLRSKIDEFPADIKNDLNIDFKEQLDILKNEMPEWDVPTLRSQIDFAPPELKPLIESRISGITRPSEEFIENISRVRTSRSLERIADEWIRAGGDRDRIARNINRRAEELGLGRILMG